MAYLSRKKLEQLGFACIGDNVFISDKASIYNPSKISIGSNVRIDDFCILSPGDKGFDIGSFVHISAYACLLGKEKITINNFAAISIKASIFSSTSDFSGLTIPKLDGFEFLQQQNEELFSVLSKPVTLGQHTGIGAHSLVFPGVNIGTGSAVGAMSTVIEDLNPWGIYMGNPARFIKKRDQHAYNQIIKLLEKEESREDK